MAHTHLHAAVRCLSAAAAKAVMAAERRALDRALATGNLATLLESLAGTRGDRVAVETAGARGSQLTYAELERGATRIAACLTAAGIGSGDRVAIIGAAEPLWCAAFFAALRVGAGAVPIDGRATLEEQRAVLAHCGASCVLAAPEQRARAEDLVGEQAASSVVLFDAEPGHAVREPQHPVVRSANDPAVIVYTSGTTARPKGVVIGHRNLLAQLEAFDAAMPCLGERVVSFLPLNHVLELTVGMLGVLARGGHIAYCAGATPTCIAEAMRLGAPEYMVTVPLLLTALKTRIECRMRERSVAGWLLRAAFWLAARTSSPRVRRALLQPVHRQLGGCLRYFIAGGAPLDASVTQFFERLGIVVLEGYGLTEASPVVATNTPAANRRGTVGRPLPGVEVRCGRSGEILVRGPSVMLGYFGDVAGSRAAVDAEGWLHTGDTGSLDDDGFLRVTGRLKELIVLPSGKKVQPEEVERVLLGSPAVKHGCVLGTTGRVASGGAQEVCAVVVPSDGLRAAHGGDAAAMLAAVRRELQRIGTVLSAHKRPTRIVLRLEDLPMTALRKVRRAEVGAWLESLPEGSSW
jgi:long-chain acyl-CoA synthetase